MAQWFKGFAMTAIMIQGFCDDNTMIKGSGDDGTMIQQFCDDSNNDSKVLWWQHNDLRVWRWFNSFVVTAQVKDFIANLMYFAHFIVHTTEVNTRARAHK